MSILENGCPYQGSFQPEGAVSLAAAVNELNVEFNQQGKIITGVNLNGTPQALNNLSESISVSMQDDLHVTTDSPVNVARKTLQEGLRQLSSFQSVLDTIIDEVVRGERDQSFRRFNDFLQEFRQMFSLLQTLEVTFSFNYEGILFKEGQSIHQFIQGQIKVLTDTKEAMEKEDLVTLTDLLEYEIKPIFDGDLKLVLEILLKLLDNG